MKTEIEQAITGASAMALATTGVHGVNVVPVSVVKVVGDTIHLFNFFMHKTVDNLVSAPEVAFSCWQGLSGVQIKATATYVTEGALFEEAVSEMLERFPTRTLGGVIVLEPSAIFDCSADAEKAGVQLG